MSGHVASLAILYTTDTPNGPQHTRHYLYNMREHLPHDRVQELVSALGDICEDLLAARASQGRPPSRRRPTGR